jgi:hypothetical protein
MCSRSARRMGLWGWRASFILFLAFLVPLAPILAQIKDEGGSAAKMVRTPNAATSRQHILHPSIVIGDLLGRYDLSSEPLLSMLAGAGDSACKAGSQDADEETSGAGYFFLSAGTLLFGLVFAYAITPSAPEAKLTGKSASYRSSYSECYGATAKAIHVKWAWIGVGALGLFCLLVYLAVGLASSNMSN